MTFESSAKLAAEVKKRVGMVIHEGYITDTVGATALKSDHATTALMTDEGELYVETCGQVFRVKDGSVEPVPKPNKRVKRDLKDAQEIYTSRT